MDSNHHSSDHPCFFRITNTPGRPLAPPDLIVSSPKGGAEGPRGQGLRRAEAAGGEQPEDPPLGLGAKGGARTASGAEMAERSDPGDLTRGVEFEKLGLGPFLEPHGLLVGQFLIHVLKDPNGDVEDL